MPTRRPIVAIDIDGEKLVVVNAAVSAGEVAVRSWFSAQRPADVAATDAAAMGAWIGSELKKNKLSRSRAVFAVPRGDVVLKRMSLPRGAATTEADVAGMVRLQMSRQLTMQLEGTAVDYAPLEPVHAGEGGSAQIEVLAGAMPGDRLEWVKSVAAAAGVSLERVGLKAAGVAALLAGASERRDGPILGIAPGASSTEFVIVDDGALAFARGVDIGRPANVEEWGSFSERVAVEAKRTAMSYRGTRETAGVEAIAVLGEGELARLIGIQCGLAMERPYEAVGLPRVVQLPADMPEAERSVAAPLIGLLAERFIARPTLDFAHPRKPPDVRARRRQLALAGVLALILGSGALYLAASIRLDGIRSLVEAERTRVAELRKDRDRYLRELARLRHLEAWQSAGVDWLAYIRHISDQMPDPRAAVLDELTGRLAASAEFAVRDGTPLANGWSVRQAAAFGISGKVKERATANNLRSRLIEQGVFEVKTTGADVQDRFDFELVTPRRSPDEPAPGATSAQAPGDRGEPVARAGGAR